MLAVDVTTGTVPSRLKDYEFATATSSFLLDQFLRRQYSSMDWLSAPMGLLDMPNMTTGRRCQRRVIPSTTTLYPLT